MGKLKFGVSSIVLGKEQKTENLRYDSVEWGEATTIQDFFRAGGNPSSVTPTRCKFLYTAEKLFVLFENMEEKAHHILRVNSKTKRSSRSCTFRKRVFKKRFCGFHSKTGWQQQCFCRKRNDIS